MPKIMANLGKSALLVPSKSKSVEPCREIPLTPPIQEFARALIMNVAGWFFLVSRRVDAEALEAMRSSYDFGCLPSLAPPHPVGSLAQHGPVHSAHHAYQQHPLMKNALSATDASALGSRMASEKNAVNCGLNPAVCYGQTLPVLSKKQQ